MRFDLHIHTSVSSCSEIRPEDLVQVARIKGLDGICITDHNTMGIRNHLKEGVQDNGLVVIYGMEYDTPQGDFLIFGPFENISHGMDAYELLEFTDNQGGIAIAAHPARVDRPVDIDIFNAGLLKFIESFNGRNSEIENIKARELADYYSLAEVYGSDSHTLEEIGSIYTEFRDVITGREDFIYSMKNGLLTDGLKIPVKEKA